MCLLIRIISNRRNNVNKKGNNSFLNGRLTQIKTVNFTDTTSATQGIRAVPNNIVPKNAKVIGINGLPAYDYFTWYHISNGDVYLIQFNASDSTRDTTGGINVNISYIED